MTAAWKHRRAGDSLNDASIEQRLRRAVSVILLSLAAIPWLLGVGSVSAENQTQPTQPSIGSAVEPALSTQAVPSDPDDPAIWRHPTDPARSLILATDKVAGRGGLYVFGLDGRLREAVPLDRPNNVDVEYGVPLRGRRLDVAVVTERRRHTLRIFAIPADGGGLIDLAPEGIPVLAGQVGESAEPMGIAIYKRPRRGATYAIIAPKTGGSTNYLWQYRLDNDGKGGVRATLVRRFGNFSGRGPASGVGEIEAVAVDDSLGYVYFSDERFGIRKWSADPDGADATRELAVFGTAGYQGDREGLAVYARGNGTGYIVSSDQVPGGTLLRLYRREGSAGKPHDHSETVAVIRTPSDGTDGLDVTALSLPGFPGGLLVMMNSGARNFHMYRWTDVSRAIDALPLQSSHPN